MSNKTLTVAEPPRKVTRTGEETGPNEQEIAFRAHELFLERGGVDGYALDDWLRAESELTARKRGLIT